MGKWRTFIWRSTLLWALILLAACETSANKTGSVSDETAASNTDGHESESVSLSGSFIFIEQTTRDQNLLKYDLATGQTLTLFQAPTNGWISRAIASPDGRQIVMAYAPPPPEGQIQFGYTNLYQLNAAGEAEPQPIMERSHPQEVLFNPVWSPDGRYIYFSHVVPDGIDSNSFTITLKRLDTLDEDVEAIVTNGVWPRLSADGEKLAYALLDPGTQTRDLYLADADGKNARLIASSEDFIDLDAPLFSPDGTWYYFSAVTQDQPSRTSWWERLLGVKVAAAHSVPSDWWRIPVDGGTAERLTQISAIGMYGAFSPDGTVLAFSSTTGIYTMNPDGTELSKLLEIPAADSLTWVP